MVLGSNSLKEQLIIMLSYKQKIYEGTIIRIFPYFFLATFDIPKDEVLTNIENGEMVGFSAHLEEEYVCFSSKIIGIKHGNDELTLVFSDPNVESRVERRNYIRVTYEAPIYYALLPGYLESSSIEAIPKRFKSTNNMIRTPAIDLSAGGIRIQTHIEYKEGDLVLLQIPLESNILLMARVVRTEAARTFIYRTALQFVNLIDEQRQALSAYVIAKLE